MTISLGDYAATCSLSLDSSNRVDDANAAAPLSSMFLLSGADPVGQDDVLRRP
jgi:hypothetical protein